jgi:hypothetical protein
MKKYLKEIGILFIQLIMLYIFPLLMHLYEPLGTVMMILFVTLILSIVLGYISKYKIKYLYPMIISILFIPSIFIYYNESALIHSVWYLVISLVGIFAGSIIKFIVRK